MKKTRIISMLLVLALMLSMLPMTALAAEEEFKVTVSIEGLTLGQGFYAEPRVYTLDEINARLGRNCTGNKDVTAAMVTQLLIEDAGMEWKHSGELDGSTFYLSSIKVGKELMNRPVKLPQTTIDQYGSDLTPIKDHEWLGEFCYSSASGWMITVDNALTPVGAGAFPVENGDVIRWRFSVFGWGADIGCGSSWGGTPNFQAADMDALFAEYARQEHEGLLTPVSRAAALEVMTHIDASQEEADAAYAALVEAGKPGEPEVPDVPEDSRQPQDVSNVLNDTLDQLMVNTPNPTVGTLSGEWTVLALARSGRVGLDNAYFTGYYDKVIKYADDNDTDGSGKLHSKKSTDNSRVILGLTAIGKDPRKVGSHDLTLPLHNFSDPMDYVGWQGNNGTCYALLALDTNNYSTDEVRNQLIDCLLAGKDPNSPGWGISQESAATVDTTAMVGQALAPYYNKRADVKAALDATITWLSDMQQDNGCFSYNGGATSESTSQVICFCAAMGINPDTDPRFVKNGVSAVDNLLSYYDPASKMFRHSLTGNGDGMATDQAAYALVAYQRLLNGQSFLYDMTDVMSSAPEEPDVPDYPGKDLDGLVAYLNMTEKVSNKPGTQFPVKVDIQGWDNEGKYKLMDCLIHIPDYVDVESVALDDSHFTNGKLEWNVDANRDLRIVFADLDNAADLLKTGEDNIVPFFTINMKVADTVDTKNEYDVTMGVGGMSVKLNSNSDDENSQIIVNIEYAKDTVTLCQNVDKPDPDKPDGTYTGTKPGTGFNFTTGILYQGDGKDLIPESKMAICVQITNLSQKAKLTFKPEEGEAISFLYNEAVSKEAKVNAYVAILDSSIDMEQFKNAASYTLMFDQKDIEDCAITFGDTDENGVVNAQDALAVVNAWLRKTEAVTDRDILHMNVNCDSRVNTYDALGIMENFVDGHGFAVVNKATTISSRVK